MSIYHRYFQILDAATLAAIKETWEIRKAYRDSLDKVKESIGAESVYFYSRHGGVAGFGFNSLPDLSVFKKVEGQIYYPKRSTKHGKAICLQIEALKKPGHIDDVLKISGLFPDFCLTGEATRAGIRMYSASVCGSQQAGWFAVVPWRDEDPASLEQYKAEKEAGTRGCAELDHLLWVTPSEWVEVKEWELKKAMDEASTENGK